MTKVRNIIEFQRYNSRIFNDFSSIMGKLDLMTFSHFVPDYKKVEYKSLEDDVQYRMDYFTYINNEYNGINYMIRDSFRNQEYKGIPDMRKKRTILKNIIEKEEVKLRTDMKKLEMLMNNYQELKTSLRLPRYMYN